MARAKVTTKGTPKQEHGDPKFPYTTKPGSLRKFLQMVPDKPKPPKVVTRTLETWGFNDSNDASMLRVLKRVGLLSESGEPTDRYAAFMKKDTGPASLGTDIRAAYRELFEHVADPPRASNEDLVNFFNINSGGSEKTIQYQVQTFKALADNARFEAAAAASAPGGGELFVPADTSPVIAGVPRFHIDLHVHLPENKSRNDYDAIFESIATHILAKR